MNRPVQAEMTPPTKLSGPAKALVAVKTLRNWPLVVVDMLGLRPTVEYHLRSGAVFTCRSKGRDTDEVVTIMAGLEYPAQFLTVKQGAVVVDAGANVGAFGVFFDQVNSGRSYAGYGFEPLPANLELLRANLTASGVEAFEVVSGVLHSEDGTAVIRTDVDANAIHVSDSGDLTVPSYRLSTFIAERGHDRVDLLKMDIEGGEYAVIDTDGDFLRSSVARIIMEFHRTDAVPAPLAYLEERLGAAFDIRLLHQVADNGVVLLTNRLVG